MAILIKTSKVFDRNSTYYKDLISVAKTGEKMKLSSGDNWFIGKGFIASLNYWADSYKNNTLKIWINDGSKDYYEAKKDLLKLENIIFVNKGADEFKHDFNI